jgi:hypothetical protein
MAPSDVHVQTAGAWKEGEMARAPGGLLRRSLPGASNGAGRLQMAPDEQRGSRQPLSQTRPSRRSSQGRRAWLAAVAQKIAERGRRKATPFGAGNRPTYGCGVGTRAPVAPSPALPAGLLALAASERRMDADPPRQMESALVTATSLLMRVDGAARRAHPHCRRNSLGPLNAARQSAVSATF